MTLMSCAGGLVLTYMYTSPPIPSQITVEWRDPSSSPSFSPSTRHAQFKLTDKTVHVFAKGMSQAVL